jgi:L-lactate dehydrogenase complex protein LldG
MSRKLVDQFVFAARNVGADVQQINDLDEAASYIHERVDGPLLLAPCASLARTGIAKTLETAAVEIVAEDFRQHGASAIAGLTGANFGIAATGTVVLESTAEAVRIATTLPEKHFVLLDPRKILATADEAVPLLDNFHKQLPQAYLAYITGPSRTADIERVLTIGVHGPAELHILLVEGLSEDLMER